VEEAVGLGLLFGMGAGLTVGPIFITIVHEALTRGLAAALRVIVGSAVADVLLLIPAVAASWAIARIESLTGVIALAGAAYFVFLSAAALRDSRRMWRSGDLKAPRSGGWAFGKGVLGNLLNPLSWTFWLATGTPTMVRVYQRAEWPGLVVFTAVWFGVAMAVEATVALFIVRARRVIGPRQLAVLQAAGALAFAGVAILLLVNRGV
jgi:threonine/homoserine/homoserine lactone efflux protein